MTSPMQRTIALYKKRGIKCQVVERYFPRSKKYPWGCKQDLFNIIDLIALDHGIVGVQVCGTDWNPHINKIKGQEKENTMEWLSQPGARLELHGWRKVKKKRGGKAMVWKPRIADFRIFHGDVYCDEREIN